jgi:hypothetical protein
VRGSGSPRLVHNGITVIGAVLTTVSAIFFLFLFFVDVLGLHANPYVGIISYLVLPVVFVTGLLLIPAGVWRERRRRLAGLPASRLEWPRVDLNDGHQRRVFFAVAALTVVNVLIVSLAAYQGLEYMDSTEFCGEVCHTVMEPEYVAFQDGPHSRVKCVECHIGPGAPWFVRSKIDGVRQVFAVAFDTYERPIPTPVHSLRPARDTCEQCHWPERFSGDLTRVFRTYADDEANTEEAQRITLKVGGGGVRFGGPHGIHWHTSRDIVVEYITTDESRQTIPWVRMTDADGVVTEFRVEGVSDEELASGQRRTMDCVDCHNRPTHQFAASPGRAVDAAITAGVLPADLPYVRREAVAALGQDYPDAATAQQRIAEALRRFYAEQYPDLAAGPDPRLVRAVDGAQRVYTHNVFPAMRLTWGTHPNHLGHTDFPGCFRCHGGEHTAKDGRTIRQDCDICHSFE